MSRGTYALGLDSSTQSMTAIVVDTDERKVVFEKSLVYARDPRLNGFGIDHRKFIVPPREPGEADQPPEMFLESVDAILADMKAAGVDMGRIGVVNCSAQQHGHVYCGAEGLRAIVSLNADVSEGHRLVDLFDGAFSYGTAPIWKTSNTVSQAEAIRNGAGGKEGVIRISGSDSPLRFTGAVIRRVGEQFPASYEKTERVFLISSFLSAVFAGNRDAPWDFGNACGTGLMDYGTRKWSSVLIRATSDGLPGGEAALGAKLPALASPRSAVGTVARYFVDRYGFSPDCLVGASSGDNPQSKVLVTGDLLSLGTSFVNMVSTDGSVREWSGFANAMYDGLGRPFMFGCRTNGALVWDRVRALHGLAREDYGPANRALDTVAPGAALTLWQPDTESFPPSRKFDISRGKPAALDTDYAGIIDSSLGLTYLYSRPFCRDTTEALSITGGPASQPQIMRRVAAIWNRPVVTTGKAGAALGAAVAGAAILADAGKASFDAESFSAAVLPRGETVKPRPEDVAAYHGEGGYLARLRGEFEKLAR